MGIREGERDVEFVWPKGGEVAEKRGDRAERIGDADANGRVEPGARVGDHLGAELLKRCRIRARDDYHAADPRRNDNDRNRVERDRLGESGCTLKP